MVTTQYLCDVCMTPFPRKREAKDHESIPITHGSLYSGFTFRYGSIYPESNYDVGVIVSREKPTISHVRTYNICTVNNRSLIANYNPHWIRQYTIRGDTDIRELSDHDFESIKDRLWYWIEREMTNTDKENILHWLNPLSNKPKIEPQRLI